MTRILVCGGGDECPVFVHNTLNEVNRIYGPVTCVVHANHPQALAWQQHIARRQVTRHLPILENRKDGVAAGHRHRDRLFAEGRPNYVVVFETPGKAELPRPGDKLSKVEYITHRALDNGIEVLKFAYDPFTRKPTAIAAKAIAAE